jgi:hypothetical protein
MSLQFNDIFCCCVYIERETIVPAQFTPSPGAYETGESTMKVGNSNNKSSGVLHSKTKRFVPAKSAIGPGPGELKASVHA